MDEYTIEVQVIYARPGEVIRRTVTLPSVSSVMDAVQASGILDELPAGTYDEARLGVFSRRVNGAQRLHQGDRVEIYHPLRLDPMEARRRRAS